MRRTFASIFAALATIAALAPVPAALAAPPPQAQQTDSFSCRASGERVSIPPLIFSEPIVSNKPGTPCADDDDSVAKAAVPGVLTTGLLETSTDLNPGGVQGADADASVNNTTITLGGAVIKAQVLTSHADVRCGPNGPVLSGSSKVVGLNLNGTPINVIDQPVTIPANPLVVIAINEQTVSNGTLTQRALHVFSPLLGADVVVSEAIADYEGNPCPPAPKPECSDDIDNADPEDTLVDENDPGCHTDGDPNNPDSYDPNDDDETDAPAPKPECSDDIDNADPEDTLVDENDPGCHTDGDPNNPDSYDPNDDDETDVPKAQCSDDLDNDDDKLTDEQDPGCHTDSNPDNPDSYDPNDDDESDK
jgi:hypothetical protein